MNLVVDCSVFMSNILPNEEKSKIEYHLYDLYVPSIFFLECSNVLLTALKKNRILENDYREYISSLKDMPIRVDDFSSSSQSLYFLGRLAKENDLTAYDASYLELALRIGAKMATCDEALKKACKKNKIILI